MPLTSMYHRIRHFDVTNCDVSCKKPETKNILERKALFIIHYVDLGCLYYCQNRMVFRLTFHFNNNIFISFHTRYVCKHSHDSWYHLSQQCKNEKTCFSHMRTTKVQISLRTHWVGWFESYLVKKPEDRFSHDVAHLVIIIISLFVEDNIFDTNASLTYGPRLQR